MNDIEIGILVFYGALGIFFFLALYMEAKRKFMQYPVLWGLLAIVTSPIIACIILRWKFKRNMKKVNELDRWKYE